MKFIRYSNVKFVKGFSRGAIYDLQNSEFRVVPNELVDFSDSIIGKTRTEIFKLYDLVNNQNIVEYLDFLEDKYGSFVSDEIYDCFSEISDEWDFPGIITNAHVENYLLKKKEIYLLDSIGVKSILFEFDKNPFYKSIELEEYLSHFSQTSIDEITINLLNYDNSAKKMQKIIKSCPKLQINYFNCRSRPEVQLENINFYEHEFEKLINKVIPPTIELYFESRSHHIYFNRKIYIGSKGQIRNSAESRDLNYSISSVSKDELKDLVNNHDFRENFDIKKDNCDICNICEYRYCCLDKRIPIKRSDNTFYFLSECDYNPLINKWKTEKDYLSPYKTGAKSSSKGFLIDERKVKMVNHKIWSQ